MRLPTEELSEHAQGYGYSASQRLSYLPIARKFYLAAIQSLKWAGGSFIIPVCVSSLYLFPTLTHSNRDTALLIGAMTFPLAFAVVLRDSACVHIGGDQSGSLHSWRL